jgi:RNA polymerase sigma-70 factor (ECF subfamily)
LVASLHELSDEQLVALCRSRDPRAWSELVERFARYVHAICVNGFRLSAEDAEDVFQDVFAKTYEQLDRLRDDAAIRPWLAQLTRRTCIDRLRSGRRSSDEQVIDVPDPVDVLADLERALDVHEALRSLGQPCHEILDRFFARDESYRTIGEALALPPGTIASRISRCLDKLRQGMEDRGRSDRPVDG